MKHKSIIIYIILFILLGVASAFILHHTKKIETTLPQKRTVDTFVHNATFTEYNQQGLIKTKIHAAKIFHYQPQGTTFFEKPFIITYTENRRPWHIRANQGTSDRTGQKIILSGNVIARELPMAEHAGTIIKTAEITIYPKKFLAETNESVMLIRPGMTLHGTGLTANLKTGEYQLHSGSEAIYQPEQKKK
jgi:lipopolysaccharide export system protein LptC